MPLQDEQRFSDLAATIESWIFDNDGVTFAVTPEINNDCTRATALAACDLIPGLSFDTAQDLARQSYRLHHSSRHVFVTDYGVSAPQIHEAYHRRLNVALIAPDPTLPALLDALPQPKALLSEGSLFWMRQVLNHTGLDRFFDAPSLFPFERTGYVKKAESPQPFRFVLDAMGFSAARTVALEDSPRNLLQAKALGLTTVLITRGQKVPREKYPYIDFYWDDLSALSLTTRA